MKYFCYSLLFLFFSCKKKDNSVKPQNKCLIPTEVGIKASASGNILFTLIGTDSVSIAKVSWTIISPDRTLQIETNGSIFFTEKFSKSGDFRVTAVVETLCQQKITLTRNQSVQLNTSGLVWTKKFEGQADTLSAILATLDGGCIVAGTKRIPGTDNSVVDATVIYRINPSGSILWSKEIPGGFQYIKYSSIIRTPDGGYLLGGSRLGHYYILKINQQGDKIWDKTFAGNNYDVLTQVINTSDGGYLVAGSSSSSKGGDKSEASRNSINSLYTIGDYWVIKVNALGNKEWDKTFGGNNNDQLSGVAETIEGGFILCGYSNSSKSGDRSENPKGLSNTWLVKVNRTGIKEWDTELLTNRLAEASQVLVTPNGSIILGGSTISKINANGAAVWSNAVTTPFINMSLSSSGNVIWIGGYPVVSILNISSNGEVENNRTVNFQEFSGIFAVSSSSTADAIFVIHDLALSVSMLQ